MKGLQALFLALLCGCTHSEAADIRLTDDTGHEIRLERPARRIVSLAPHITETLFAAGAGDKVVATVSYSDYPEAAKALPEVGSYDRISLESLVATAPDLVLAWRSGNGDDVVRRLRQLGLTVYVSEPRRLVDIAATLRKYATLAGTSSTGEAAADAFERRLASLRQTYSHRAPVAVFYQVWNDPLLTLNGEHLISDVIRLCGGRNIFADARPLVPIANIESIVSADPEVIIASGMGEERPEWVDAWRRWPGLRAVKENHLYFIPPSLLQRHSPRILQGAERLCRFVATAREEPR